jgi:hypothetical protein
MGAMEEIAEEEARVASITEGVEEGEHAAPCCRLFFFVGSWHFRRILIIFVNPKIDSINSSK